MNRQISISDAEWTIMKALWQSEDKKMTLKEIAEAVADSGWFEYALQMSFLFSAFEISHL